MNGQNGILTCSALKKTYRNILLNGAENWTTRSEVTEHHEQDNISGNRAAANSEIDRQKVRKGNLDNDTCEQNHKKPDCTQPKQDKTPTSNKNVLSEQNVLFVYLKGSKEILQGRIGSRKGHFMPASLLDSQIATLEEPGDDEPHITVDVALSIEALSSQICQYLSSNLTRRCANFVMNVA